MIKCPKCESSNTKVTAVTKHPSGKATRRFKKCKDCGHMYRTVVFEERLDDDAAIWHRISNPVHTKKTLSELARGENNLQAKLTVQNVIGLRQEYARGGVTFQQLADKAGLHRNHVRGIVRGIYWRHVPGAVPAKPTTVKP